MCHLSLRTHQPRPDYSHESVYSPEPHIPVTSVLLNLPREKLFDRSSEHTRIQRSQIRVLPVHVFCLVCNSRLAHARCHSPNSTRPARSRSLRDEGRSTPAGNCWPRGKACSCPVRRGHLCQVPNGGQHRRDHPGEGERERERGEQGEALFHWQKDWLHPISGCFRKRALRLVKIMAACCVSPLEKETACFQPDITAAPS